MSLIKFKRFSINQNNEFIDYFDSSRIDNLKLCPISWNSSDDKPNAWILSVQIGNLNLNERYEDYKQALDEFDKILNSSNEDKS